MKGRVDQLLKEGVGTCKTKIIFKVDASFFFLHKAIQIVTLH